MPVVSLEGPSFLASHGPLNWYHVNIQRPAYGMLGHLTVHSRDQHMVA